MNEDIQTLIGDLTCDDVIKCQKARRELVEKGSAAVDALGEALSSKKTWVRWEAAKALGQIGDKSAVEALVAALEDKQFDIRWQASEALIRIGPAALEPLLALLAQRGDKSLAIRRGAHHILHDMNRGKYDGILQPVMAAVEDGAPTVEVLVAAEKALEELRKMKRSK